MPPKRFAIVIGNSKYSNLGTINGARKDAIDICNTLASLESGWEFGPCGDPVLNATRQQMHDAEGWLIAKLKDEIQRDNRNCQTVIYFAGHGKVIKGDTYLLPCDYELPDRRGDEDERKMTFPVEAMLKNLNGYKNLLNMMIVDACRTEDYLDRDGNDKLWAPKVAGSIVCFGTSSGSKAREDRGGHGWFTGKLLMHIAEPGVQVREVLFRACRGVVEDYGEKQRPDIHVGFFGDAYFADPRASAPAPSSPAVPATRPSIAKAPAKLAAPMPAARPRAVPIPVGPVGCKAEFNQKWESAHRGDAAAQFWISEQFFHGESGVKKDLSVAASWLRKSAEGGNTSGMNKLGEYYLNGWGVERDENAAVSWFRKSAEGEDPDGMQSLGDCYENGKGVEQDEVMAYFWRKKCSGARVWRTVLKSLGEA